MGQFDEGGKMESIDPKSDTRVDSGPTSAIGPQTIWIGEEGSQSFFVPAGTINFNTNTHTEFLVCAAAAIPTLSEWGMILMTLMLAAVGLYSLRRPTNY